MKFFKYKSQD